MRWRQDTTVPHHVYEQHDVRPQSDGDRPVATFLRPEDATLAVNAVNTWLAEHGY